LEKEFKYGNKEIYRCVNKINGWFISLKDDHEGQNEFTIEQLGEELAILLTQFIEGAEKVLQADSSPNLLEVYFKVNTFLKIVELVDDHYVIYGEKVKNDVTVKLFCIDPSLLLKKMGKGYRSKVFFSATLSPLPYYQDILGGQEEDYFLSIPSPFKKEQTDIFIKPLSTRYRDRERTMNSIVSMIHSLVQNRPGNYLIFFPSYHYLLTVYEQFLKAFPEVNTLVQGAGMSEGEREAFLEEFKPNQTGTLIGFAVLGGVFSEGVDLKGNRLNGVVVIGVGLPQLCYERNLIKDYFSEREKNGYDYAYVYPGMNKVLQAGGRLIRSEQDHGTIVLVDDRFLQRQYLDLLPEEWRSFTII
jgi:DNA excision repair protein ERCC-2